MESSLVSPGVMVEPDDALPVALQPRPETVDLRPRAGVHEHDEVEVVAGIAVVGEVDGPLGVSMTASLGIASFPLHARTQEELVEYADRAMQRIKKSTKNAIGISEIEEGEHVE